LKPCGNPTTTIPIAHFFFDIGFFLITVDMDEPDSHIMQQTPPPSPYLETTWDLPLKEVRQGLLNPKEKRRGYLELYFAGFMEFADSPPSPAMSDDETEYPRWGKVTGTRDSRPSTATAEVPQSPETSTFSDTNESIIHPLSRRTGMCCILGICRFVH
jgi:hypothetical protein